MPRWPTGPFELHRTGCYGCVRTTSADGACGIAGYPCKHYGDDLFAKTRDVVAPETGTVVAVGNGSSAPWVGYGPGVVVIKGDGTGKFLLMGHLTYSSIEVSVGQHVIEGQHIALFDPGIGHTHFEVRHNLTGPSATNTLDPADWVNGRWKTVVALVALGFAGWWLTKKLSRGVA